LPIKNRRRDLPLAPVIGLGGSKGAHGTFKPEDIAAIEAEVGKSCTWSREAMASNLDFALTVYLGRFATAADGAPSEKEEWAANLRTAAANCLAMIAPSFDPQSGGRLSVDQRAHAHLFSLFPAYPKDWPPLDDSRFDGLNLSSEVASTFSRDPALARSYALSDIADSLALLWSLADKASKGWSSRKKKTTNKVLSWRLSWVVYLAPSMRWLPAGNRRSD